MRNGVLIGGNWIIDRVKIIDSFPTEESLSNILVEYKSNGGSAYNILKDLSRMQAPISLEAVGLLGDDELAEEVFDECRQLSIGTSQLKKTQLANTSYTDVMSVKSSGKRTFFHYRGANALLEETNFNFDNSGSKIFHLGYLLLLDKLDIIQKDGRTGAARVLKQAIDKGFITSVDLVSEASERFGGIVTPSLPFIDYLFINEFEASKLTGLQLIKNREVVASTCLKAALQLLKDGVRQWVILHYPKGVIAVNKNGRYIFQPSVAMPVAIIAGTVGAGDAFAAGVLMGIHEGWDMELSLQLGVSVAASSLLAATCSDGILSFKECLELPIKYGYINNNNLF